MSSLSSPVVTEKSYPCCSSDSDMNLVRQSLVGTNNNDVDAGLDVYVADIKKGQESSVAVAQQALQQHSVSIEDVSSRRITKEDDETYFRNTMMIVQQQKSTASNNDGTLASSSICIRISDLSHNLRKSVKDLQLDLDGDGQLDTEEILWAVKQLITETKTHSNLKQIIVGLCTFLILLIVCVAVTSITAARLITDTEIDPMSGIVYVKVGGAHSSTSSTTIMKTGAVEIYSNSAILAKLTTDELDILKAILPGKGDVKFQVKGYARNGNNELMVLVEGGTITYDSEGIKDATGNAKVLLTFAYGDVLDYSNHYRYSCNDGYVSGARQ